MADALQELKRDSTLSVTRTAGRYGLPPSTLRDRVKGRQNPRAAHQHECLLSPQQEVALAKWAIFQDDMGIPPRQEMLREKAQAILRLTSPEAIIGVRWIDRFMKRNKELQMKFSQRIERQRAAANNPRVLEKYFQIFNKMLRDYKIKPENIWNMDEKGFMMGMACRVKVICRKGRKNPRYTHDGNREIITVLECVCASGRVLPPLIVTKGSHHYAGNHMKGQGPPGAVYAHSPKGWTTNELGLAWLKEHYETHTAPE